MHLEPLLKTTLKLSISVSPFEIILLSQLSSLNGTVITAVIFEVLFPSLISQEIMELDSYEFKINHHWRHPTIKSWKGQKYYLNIVTRYLTKNFFC